MAEKDRLLLLDSGTRARYERLTRDELIARLTLAEPVCVLLGWTAAHLDSPREKALHELWRRWEVASLDSGPQGWPEVDEALIEELAAKRDATRAATLRHQGP